jgi:DnaJ-class molecular chaperone
VLLHLTVVACTLSLHRKADVLTLDGMVELTIPAGTTPDTVLMMRKRGVQVSALQVELEAELYIRLLVLYFLLISVAYDGRCCQCCAVCK